MAPALALDERGIAQQLTLRLKVQIVHVQKGDAVLSAVPQGKISGGFVQIRLEAAGSGDRALLCEDQRKRLDHQILRLVRIPDARIDVQRQRVAVPFHEQIGGLLLAVQIPSVCGLVRDHAGRPPSAFFLPVIIQEPAAHYKKDRYFDRSFVCWRHNVTLDIFCISGIMQAIQERPADLIFLTRRTYARLILLRRLTLMALFFIPKYFNRGIVLCLASIVIAPFLLAAMYTVFSPIGLGG